MEDGNGVAILCKRNNRNPKEATFFFTGVLVEKSTMPYHHYRELVAFCIFLLSPATDLQHPG